MSTDVPLARRDTIAGRLARGEPVGAAALAAEFRVSEDAIRRDLRALAALGRCRRVYGGALPVAADALPMAARIGLHRERKEALARAAAATIRRGEFVFLDSGSANLALAGLLPKDGDLTVATNCVDIAAALIGRSDLGLVIVGGAVDWAVGGCIDATAIGAVVRMNIDRAFVGACSVDARRGISAHHLADATFKRALLAASRISVVLAMNDKLGAQAAHRVAAARDVDAIVVERDADARDLRQLARAGASLLKADRPA